MRARYVLPLVTAAALLGGCGGSSSPQSSAVDQPSPVAPTPSQSGSTGGAAATTTGGGTAGGATTGAGIGTGSSTGGSTGSSTGATSTAGGGAAPGSAAGTGTAPSTHTAPGTYTYDVSGTVTAGTPRDASGTSTLTVDQPSGGRQHSKLANSQGSTAQDVVVRSTGTYLATLAISNPAFDKTFRFATPVLLVPDPPTPGRSWSFTGTSTDGKTHLAVTAKIARRETLTIGGVPTATAVVTSTLRLTGDVTYTADMETWYDPAHRLTAKDHTRGSGTYGGLAFQTDLTAVLRSTRPS